MYLTMESHQQTAAAAAAAAAPAAHGEEKHAPQRHDLAVRHS